VRSQNGGELPWKAAAGSTFASVACLFQFAVASIKIPDRTNDDLETCDFFGHAESKLDTTNEGKPRTVL
jgi:hypothetical protein